MAKNSSHRRKLQSKSKTMRRNQKGGDLAGNPPSSWGWVNGTVGNGWTQFMNSLTLQPGQGIVDSKNNDIIPVGNLNAQGLQGNIGSNLQGDIPKSVGGRRRSKSRSKSYSKSRSKSYSKSRSKSQSKHGGSWGAIFNQAAVPGILLAAQQSFGRRKSSRRH
jgi:hypothetical protein